MENNLTIFLDGGVYNGKEFHFESWDDFFDKKSGSCLPSGYILSDLPYCEDVYTYMSTAPFSRDDSEIVLQYFGYHNEAREFTIDDNFPGDLQYLLRDMQFFIEMNNGAKKDNDETATPNP